MTGIRPEVPADHEAVRRVHVSAFPSDLEALLVEQIRAADHATVSLVAERDGQIVGHILFSPVAIAGHPAPGTGLAPMAVLPEWQRRGIGSLLVRGGLEALHRAGQSFVVVLGSPEYYQRFGFTRASLRGLRNEFGFDEEFMAIELVPGSLPAEGGLVRYGPEFSQWVK